MHKSSYRVREMLDFGGLKLPGVQESHYLGSEYSGNLYGKEHFDHYSVTRVCFCEVYRKYFANEQRPVPKGRRIRYVKRLLGGAYRRLEAWITENRGFKRSKRDFMSKYFPPASEWGVQ